MARQKYETNTRRRPGVPKDFKEVAKNLKPSLNGRLKEQELEMERIKTENAKLKAETKKLKADVKKLKTVE